MERPYFINDASSFNDLISVCEGRKLPDKVHQIEVIFDEEIKKEIMEKYLGIGYHPPAGMLFPRKEMAGSKDYRAAKERYYRSNIDFHYHMGYSLVTDHDFLIGLEGFNSVSSACKDVAPLSRGKRAWAQQGSGMIRDWKSFEVFPWDEIERLLDSYYEHIDLVSKNLYDDMKIAAVGAVNAQILGWVLGFEGLFYLLRDDYSLVKAVFDRMGSITYKMYEIACSHADVAVLWHGDDLGFKTSTMYSPDTLRDLLFPWMKKYSSLAHASGKRFWVHCCGYKESIMKDFIEDIKIDALHSFEEACCPVRDYKEKYGGDISILGGVDVDILARAGEQELRSYIRDILESCQDKGRYILGSGNSITNYIPIKNYLIMLEEGYNWYK